MAPRDGAGTGRAVKVTLSHVRCGFDSEPLRSQGHGHKTHGQGYGSQRCTATDMLTRHPRRGYLSTSPPPACVGPAVPSQPVREDFAPRGSDSGPGSTRDPSHVSRAAAAGVAGLNVAASESHRIRVTPHPSHAASESHSI